MITANYITSVLLIVLGLYAVCTRKNLIKVIIGFGLTDYGINLLIVSIGFHEGGTAPIWQLSDLLNGTAPAFFVDPVPQALTLTSIVIGACSTAMTLSLIIMIKKQYGTLKTDKIRRLKG